MAIIGDVEAKKKLKKPLIKRARKLTLTVVIEYKYYNT